MKANQDIYRTYVRILERELISAMGCTEPIAVAYCAAYARSVLGAVPERIVVEASGNIIKNAKSVIVPNTGGRKGIAAAACIGVLAGDEKSALEVISHVSQDAIEQLGDYMEKTPVEVKALNSEHILDLIVTVFAGDDHASVRIANEHTNIIRAERNGEVLLNKDPDIKKDEEDVPDYSLLSVKDICDFAREGDPFCLYVTEILGECLGLAMSYISCTIDPEVFLIGGGLSRAGSILLDAIRKGYAKYAIPVCRHTAVTGAALGNDAGIYGCIRMVLDTVQ